MYFVLIRHILSFVFSFFLCFYLVPLMIQASKKLKIFDVPDGKIKVHKNPTPYLGGVAIYISFVASAALFYPVENKILWLILGSTFLFLVGLLDDLRPLSPKQKLIGQIIATLCFLKGGFSLKTYFFESYINIFASGFWILSIINAFNLVDVMDGLASTLAITSASSFAIIAFVLGKYDLTLLLVSFLGSVIAFLFFNRPPAKIYLGDAGSMFIGGFLSAIPLLIRWSMGLREFSLFPEFISHNSFLEIIFSAAIPVMCLGIPALEILYLVAIRTFKGIPFYSGSPHHFSIYLKNKDWRTGSVLIFSALMSSILSLIAILFMFGFLNFYLFLAIVFAFLAAWHLAIYQ